MDFKLYKEAYNTYNFFKNSQRVNFLNCYKVNQVFIMITEEESMKHNHNEKFVFLITRRRKL